METGIDYYRHALAQARETGARSEVLFELGQAEAAAGRVEAREHLERALAECVERVRRAEIVTALSRSVAVAGGAEQSMQILRGEIDHFDSADDDASMLFGTEVLAAAQFVVEAQSLIPPRLDVVERLPHAHDNHRLLAFLAQRAVFSNEPATKAVELGSRAIGDGRLLATETAYSPFCRYAIDALTLAGAYDRAAEACQWMLADARDRGSMAATLYASLSRCLLFLHRGSVVDAEAEATAALEMAVQPGLTLVVPAAAGLFLESLIERADLQAAESVLEDAGLAGDVDTTGAFLLLSARGRLRFLQARYCDALFDLTESGRRQEALGIVSSAWAPWRPTASLALLALGEVDEALRVSATELRLARQFGAPRTLGVALRVAGLVQGDEHGIEYLREAVRVLAPSGANVEYARALADLGAALRRRGQSIEARDLLREAFAVASRCEAAAVGIHARSELEVAGGRPGRRIHHEGLEALTMSERRVAQLASLRLTNTEIAQTLFVTVKTVEAHLSSAYRKLGINSRRELALALRGEPPAQSLPSPMFRVNP